MPVVITLGFRQRHRNGAAPVPTPMPKSLPFSLDFQGFAAERQGCGALQPKAGCLLIARRGRRRGRRRGNDAVAERIDEIKR